MIEVACKNEHAGFPHIYKHCSHHSSHVNSRDNSVQYCNASVSVSVMELHSKPAMGLCRLLWALALICLVHVPVTQAQQTLEVTRQTKTVVDCLKTKTIPLVAPSDKQYANLSASYNLRIQNKPAVVVFPEGIQHISDAILCATKYKLKVQARSGGHSYASYSTATGELIIDTQNFQNVSVDKKSYIATFGAGVRLGNLELALRPYGRALPHGTDSRVGAGGHFTMGGDGFTTRTWGLAIDSLVGMDVVLANGSLVHATAKSYSDVFFVRGIYTHRPLPTASYDKVSQLIKL